MKIGINGIILMEKPAGIANLIIRTANYLVKTEEIIIYSNKELNQDVLKRLDEKIRICIPKTFFYYQYSTLYRKFFSCLGCDIVISGPTTDEVIKFMTVKKDEE